MSRANKPEISKDEIANASIKFFSRWRPHAWIDQKYENAPGPAESKFMCKLIARYKRQQAARRKLK